MFPVERTSPKEHGGNEDASITGREIAPPVGFNTFLELIVVITFLSTFSPSPCPVHYGGHWLLRPLLTSVQSPHESFHEALSGFPKQGECSVSGLPVFFEEPDRSLDRSPQIRTGSFLTQPPRLPYPPSHRILSCCADSSQGSEPSTRFLFVGSSVCSGLPSDIPSRVCLCLSLVLNATDSLSFLFVFSVC